MKNAYLVLLISFLFSRIAQPVFASPLINEVYPRPNTNEKEWIELFNNTEENVDLAGWMLKDELTTPSIIFQFTPSFVDEWKMKPFEFLIIEIETSKLNNTADGIKLINNIGDVIDQFEYINSELGMSFAVITDSINNQTSIILTSPSKGFSNTAPASSPLESVNSSPAPTASPTPINSPIPTTTSSPAPINSPAPTSTNIEIKTYPSLSIYEVMSCPKTDTQEWIKIKNTNSEAVNLNNWILKDFADNQIILTSSEIIPEQSFLIIYLKNNILNNSGDTIILIDPNGKEIDKIELGECTLGKSIYASNSSNEDISITSDALSLQSSLKKENFPNNGQLVTVKKIIEKNFISLKKINELLVISNADKSATAKIDNYISKKVVVKNNSLPKTAVLSVIIGGAMLASSGLFFIKNEKN